MALTVSATEIIAFCLESVFYGIYLALFGASVAVLHRKRAQSNLNIRLLAVSCTLFVLITSHEFVDAIRLLLSFQRNQTTSGADLFYKSVADTFSIALNSIYLIETLLSDLFMLYRCYVVWGSSWSIVMLPCFLFIAAGVTGVSTICTLKAFGDVMLFNNRLETMANSFFSCTLALNGICTGLIAFRILCTQFQNRDLAVSPYLTRVAIVIVESGAIYLASLVVLVATFSAKTIAFLIPLSATSPVIGIVFALITVRIGRGVSSETTTIRQGAASSFKCTVPRRESKCATECGFDGRQSRSGIVVRIEVESMGKAV